MTYLAVIGAVTGLAAWVLTSLIANYILEPIVCGASLDAARCASSVAIAGNISTVLIAVAATAAMLRLEVARPIIVAAASAVMVWPLAGLTDGLWWLEAIGFSVLVYALCYTLFGWIALRTGLIAAIIWSLVIAVVLRIALFLLY